MSDPSLLTAAAIAKELGVTDAKVKKTIKELAIEPTAKRGVCNLYGPDSVASVKASLVK